MNMVQGKLIRSIALAASVAILFFSLAHGGASAKSVGTFPRGSAQPTKRVKLAISDMYCKACEPSISGELLRTPGVLAATVSYERQEAVVDYDSSKITPAGIIAAIKGAGFTAKIRRS